MYNIKVVDESTGKSALYPCSHLQITHFTPEVVARMAQSGLTAEPGIVVELCNDDPSEASRIVRLPADGNVVYVMNADGDTIETHRYKAAAVVPQIAEGGAR